MYGLYQTFIGAGASTSSPNTLMGHLMPVSNARNDSGGHALRVVLERSVRPNSVLPAPLVDGLKVLFRELEVVKVGLGIWSAFGMNRIDSGRTHLDSLGSDGLGNDDKALVGSPGNENLRRGLADLIGWCRTGRTARLGSGHSTRSAG